ncbi:MAG: hypothetical protein OXE58_14755, partial [Acidobacteria bacterium]|nr:hypothetical protein [Acidobacteriota bacterium]
WRDKVLRDKGHLDRHHSAVVGTRGKRRAQHPINWVSVSIYLEERSRPLRCPRAGCSKDGRLRFVECFWQISWSCEDETGGNRV